MKALKKESRLKIPTSKFLEAADSIKGWRLEALGAQENPTGMLGQGLGSYRFEGGSLRPWGTGHRPKEGDIVPWASVVVTWQVRD